MVLMPSLQVRELPPHLHARLREEARREQRSLAQQAIVVLQRGLAIAGDPRERRRQLLARLAATPPLEWSDSAGTPEAMVRADRKR
jgi:plasmid stability protein